MCLYNIFTSMLFQVHYFIISNMEIYEQEARDNIRFVWNITPNTRVQQARAVIHPAFHYNPLGGEQKVPLPYIPLTCKCQAVFNKFCPVDFHAKTIKCCFCENIMSLPGQYAQNIGPNKLPYQLMPNNSTFEYLISNANSQQKPVCTSNAYIFLIDLCLSEKQLGSIRQQIIKTLNILNDDARICILTFNRYVYVYQLASKINTIYCINGAKQYNLNNIMDILGINYKNDPRMQSPQITKRFLVNLGENREKIIRRVQDIKVDPHIYVSQRPLRATGQALNVAISINQISPVVARIVTLTGGTCTIGPGQVIASSYKQQMRSPLQLSKGQNIPFFQTAKKYYQKLSQRLLSKKIIIDFFAFSIQQVGLTEMNQLLNTGGGLVAMHQQFSDRIFKQSFQKYFSMHTPPPQDENADDLRMVLSSQATLLIYTSKDIAINGALGQCYSLNKTKPFVSDRQMGKGKTHAWYLGSLDKSKTITILYESKQQTVKKQRYYIQIKTFYKNQEGNYVTKVTTVRRQWSDSVEQISCGFDQQAAAVYLARMCMHKAIVQQQKNLRQWVDATLCRWATYFANYIKNDRMSFILPPTMKKLPQLVYYLRRTHFVNRFGCSLDEFCYNGLLVGKQSIVNCLSMIQPVLLKYSLQSSEPQAVPLNEEEMQDQVILLLDSYLNLIEWYGPHTQSWFENNYHLEAGYQHIAELMQSPKQDIQYIMQTRFPAPNYYLTCPGHSKQRYLKSRVNPKKVPGVENQNTITDDSDLKSFTQHLIKVVVSGATN